MLLHEIESSIALRAARTELWDINQMTGWYGGEECGHIGFSPVARLTGPDAVALRDLIRGLVENEARLDYAAVLIPTNARSFIHITLVIFDTKNEA